MTVADPYPASLDEVDEGSLGFAPADPTVKALNRIAVALEQLVLNQLDRGPQPVQNAPQRPALAALPPVAVQTQQMAQQGGVCPIHNTPWKVVPAGVSKKTGKPYDAFSACSVSGCDQRPPR